MDSLKSPKCGVMFVLVFIVNVIVSCELHKKETPPLPENIEMLKQALLNTMNR